MKPVESFLQSDKNKEALQLATRPDGNFAFILQQLQTGDMQVTGQMAWSSNYTFLAHVGDDDNWVTAVYKPQRGERPLWDFPQGSLCHRECAAYLISAALGWKIVPPTVLRDGEHGLGSVQLFIDHDPDCHYFTFENASAFKLQLQQIALFDIIINNADRKGGHVLLQSTAEAGEGGHLWAIDHGICFHADYKLRTVIWEFADSPIPDALQADLATFQRCFLVDDDELRSRLEALLSPPEVTALQKRLERLISKRRFSKPGSGRHYPWPPI